MDTLYHGGMPRLASSWLPSLFIGLSLLSGCASLGFGSKQPTVASLSDQLVENLERRVTTSSVVVMVLRIHASPTGQDDEEGPPRSFPGATTVGGRRTEDHHRGDPIGTELEHAFTLELSRRLNVLDTEHAKALGVNASEEDVRSLAIELGATHVLVGDYVTKQDGLTLSLRLIDPESLLIVAAVRGKIAASDLGILVDGG